MKKPTAIILSFIAILSRLVPHPANFTAVGATSLFSGAKISRPWNYIIPFGVLIFTDIIIGLHGTMMFVYASIAVSIWMGERVLKNSPNTGRLTVTALASSTIFFIITNFGVWATTAMYPKTLAGLTQSYVMGLPFWRNMMLADVVFTVGFFWLYSYASNKNLISLVDKKINTYINSIKGGVSL